MERFFDELFGDFDAFNSNFMKRIRRVMNEIEGTTKNGNLKGGWDIKEIDEPGVKGYVIQGRFWSDEPLEPLKPLKPWRRPMPQRPFKAPGSAFKEIREPLTDVFEEEQAVKIYVELPGEEKDDIQLNVTEGKVEVKARNFHKLIDVPTRNLAIEKALSKYKNGVLEVTIPKKQKSHEKERRKIKIK